MSQFILLKVNERGKIIESKGMPGLKGKYLYDILEIAENTAKLKFDGRTYRMAKLEDGDVKFYFLIPEQTEVIRDFPLPLAIIQHGEIVFQNAAFQKAVGDVKSFLDAVNASLASEVIKDYETFRNGERRKFEVFLSRGFYNGREALFAALIDVTEDREFKRLFLTLTEKTFVVVYIIQDGKFVFLNENAEKIGYSIEELYKIDPFTLVHPEDREKVVDNYVRRLAGENVEVPYRFRLIAKDGRVFYVDAIATRVFYKGRPAVMGMLIDRTAEVENQDRLSMYERFFRQSKDMFFILDKNGRFIDVNPSYSEIHGYEKAEIIGRTSRFISHPEDLEVLRENFKKVLCGESVKFTFRVKCKSGEERIAEVVEWPVYRGGEIVGAEGVLRDITDRVTAEKELKKVNQLLKTISEINELIFRENDEYILLGKVCKVISKVRGINSFAWIFDGREVVKLTPLAPDCHLALKCSGDLIYEKCNCDFGREKSVAIPIKHNGFNFGIIVLCSVGELGGDELKILENLGENLGFAITSYRAERDRKIAFNLLVENLNQLETLADRLRNPIAVITGFLEIKDEIGHEKVLKEIERQVSRMQKILDELRMQETLTYFILRGDLVSK